MQAAYSESDDSSMEGGNNSSTSGKSGMCNWEVGERGDNACDRGGEMVG